MLSKNRKSAVSASLFNELAKKNVKKSAKDYFIYFFTLTIGEPAEGEEEAEITFECVEDETLGNELLAIFQELADAEAEEGDGIEIETEDDDDEEAEDEDDSKWDQFIHKKLDD